MNISSTQDYRALFEAIITQNADEPVDLIFVADVAAWCAQRKGENRGNPAAKAIRAGQTKRAGIVLRKEIDSDRVNGINGRLAAGGFWTEADQLNTPETFLTHLVLHELAHLLNNWGQEKENDCDAWAFKKMNI
jgi:hypothetical protein